MAAPEADRSGVAGDMDGRGRVSIGAASGGYGIGPELGLGDEYGPGPAPGAGPGDHLDIRPVGRSEPAGSGGRTGVVAAGIPAGDVWLLGGGAGGPLGGGLDRIGVWSGGLAGPIPGKRPPRVGPLRFHAAGLPRQWSAEEAGTGHPWVPGGRRIARESEPWHPGTSDAGWGGVRHSVAGEARYSGDRGGFPAGGGNRSGALLGFDRRYRVSAALFQEYAGVDGRLFGEHELAVADVAGRIGVARSGRVGDWNSGDRQRPAGIASGDAVGRAVRFLSFQEQHRAPGTSTLRFVCTEAGDGGAFPDS